MQLNIKECAYSIYSKNIYINVQIFFDVLIWMQSMECRMTNCIYVTKFSIILNCYFKLKYIDYRLRL